MQTATFPAGCGWWRKLGSVCFCSRPRPRTRLRQSAGDGCVARSACCALRHTKSSVRLLLFDCPKQASGEGQECVRVICTCVRIVSGCPLPAVALSCWRRAPLGERTQSMETTVRIVFLFPNVLSLSFWENRKHLDFFVFAILAFLEFLTFSRWFSSLKKRFKNHDGKTARPANHEIESFGRVP